MKRPIDAVRPGIRELTAYPIEHKSVPVKLDANECSFPLPTGVQEALAQLAEAVDLCRYPTGHGEPLVELLADRLGVPNDTILVGNGSNEMISLLLTAFAGDGSHRPAIVLTAPSFGVYPIQAACHGYRVETVPLSGDRFELDAAAVLEAAERVSASLLMLASPNNPTGNRFDAAQLEQVLDHFPGPVVVDEAYCAFASDSMLGSFERWPGLIVLRTLSKMGLAALRVGFSVAAPSLTLELRKAKLPFNLNALSTHVACAALECWDEMTAIAAQVVLERERLHAALGKISELEVFPSEANFLLVRASGYAPELWEQLGARGVSIRYFGSKPQLKDCLRITVGTPEENDRFLATLDEVLKDR